MANLKEVKNRIASVTSTQQITKAMKMVSASKLRKAQQRAWDLRPYADGLRAIAANLLHAEADVEQAHKLLAVSPHPEAPMLFVPIASDKGLCGTFNSSVIKNTQQRINQFSGSAQLLPLGRRVYDHFQRVHDSLISDYYNIFCDFRYAKVEEIGKYCMQAYLKGDISGAVLVYNKSKNVATQHLCACNLLPFAFHAPADNTAVADYIYEPSQAKILEHLLPLLVHVQLYQALSESNAAEHGARMTAMGKASENADQLLKDLRLSYNRTRQTVITREILEIVGGANALTDH